LVADRLAHGLRVGMLAVPGVILLLDVDALVEQAASYQPLWFELLAYAVHVVVTALSAVLVFRRRPWGRWRWPLLGAVLAANTAATAAVVPAGLIGTAHWSWEIFGWWGVLLLLDRPVWYLLAALAVNLGMTLFQVAVAGRADTRTLVGIGVVGLVDWGVQWGAWLLGAEIHRLARRAARLAGERERLRTTELVAEQLHRDRTTRYADLFDTAGALLAGLAHGDLDPGDPAVRRTSFLEAARIRRLFAEADESTEPLVHELAACVDVVARRGIAVHLAVRGRCPPLSRPVRRSLTEPAVLALMAAASTARVTVVASDHGVVVSVVTDGSETPVSNGVMSDSVRVDWVRHDGAVWMEATWLVAAGTAVPRGGHKEGEVPVR
jgi:hypothetical protein